MSSSYKIIFSDIDGTLLDRDREVSPATIQQIKKLKDKFPFILVSARMPRQMYHIQEQLGILNTPLIAYNGALVIHRENILHSIGIPPEYVEKLIHYNENISGTKFHISLYHHNEWFVEEMDDWAKREENNTKVSPQIKSNRDVLKLWEKEGKNAHKILCMGDAETIEKAFAYLNINFNNNLHLYRSKDTYIEIANKAVSKLTGIKKVLENSTPLITLNEVIAFGDNYNDEEMINAVGHGVAVENAREEVKRVANAITDHHKQDGVAKYLEKFLK